jgi:cytochrome bd ubiquinol oxidase subunit I
VVAAEGRLGPMLAIADVRYLGRPDGGAVRHAATKRTLLVVLGPVAGIVMFVAAVWMASQLMHREYASYEAAAAGLQETPSDEGQGAETPSDEQQGEEAPPDEGQAEATAADAGQGDEPAAPAGLAQDRPYVEAEYRTFPVVGSRVAIWMVAQLHLLFAAFVLAVPIFAFIVEAIGYKTGDVRYDRLAYEFTRLLSVSFSITATFGAFLTFMLIILYPKFTNYLMSVFSPTFLPYVLLFFAEAFFLYTYYYGWGKFHPLVHLGLGLGLNIVGTAIMFIANAWLTFMMSPAGIAKTGAVLSVWDAVNNYTWMPINVHRVIANVAFGGSVAAAYAAFKFLQARTDEDRAHYDWMGYIGNFVAIIAFLPLPFAGYWLAKEIYAYSQTLGLTMMGGAFSWLFIIQAILIGNLFLAANYYLWLGMGRVEGKQPLQKYIKYLLIAIALCFAVWATPRSIIATVSELRAMGGSSHPILGFLGVMSAKNTAVNILILTTFMSFLLYRRTGKVATVSWAKAGHAAQLTIFATVAVFVIFLGVYGYFVEATVRIGLSVPQVLSVLFAMVAITAIDVFLFRGASRTEVRWGRIPAISQYVLIFIAVTFTWLMGLMGYVRSGLRQHWHVYGVVRDTSVDAFTPTLGFATQVVSVTVLVFFALIGVVFWITSLHDRPDFGHRLPHGSLPTSGDGEVSPEFAVGGTART